MFLSSSSSTSFSLAERNKISKQIGALMGQGKREEAEEVKKQVAASGARIDELSAREKEVEEELLSKTHYACYNVASDHERRYTISKSTVDHKVTGI